VGVVVKKLREVRRWWNDLRSKVLRFLGHGPRGSQIGEFCNRKLRWGDEKKKSRTKYMTSMTATVKVWVRKGGKGSQIKADGAGQKKNRRRKRGGRGCEMKEK
jgi:hypothetical protein